MFPFKTFVTNLYDEVSTIFVWHIDQVIQVIIFTSVWRVFN